MKVVIAGGRDIKNYLYVLKAMETVIKNQKWEITEVVSGMARGIDTFALRWAFENQIDIKKFPADWNKLGKAAGFIRNKEMAQYADACVVIWDGKSRGSGNMIKNAKEHGIHLTTFLTEELDVILEKNEEFIQYNSKTKKEIEDYKMQEESVEKHRKDLRNNATIAKMMKRVEQLEQDVGHLKTLIKPKKSNNYGK